MKNITFTIITLFILSCQTYAQDSYTAEQSTSETKASTAMTTELTVKVYGLDSDEGTLKIGIYGSESQWLNKSQFRKSANIINGTATVIFENIPSGTYGISTYHDENSNSKLDTKIFGIPSEPYASSRGAKGRFGPPKWNDAKFDITETTHTEEIKF